MKKKEVRKITLGIVVSWIFGILFLISGVNWLLQGLYIGGLLLFILFFVVFPPINKILEKRLKLKLSRGLKIAIVIVLFILASISSIGYESSQQLPDNCEIGEESGMIFCTRGNTLESYATIESAIEGEEKYKSEIVKESIEQSTEVSVNTEPSFVEPLKITSSINSELIIDTDPMKFVITREEVIGEGWFEKDSWGDYINEVEWERGYATFESGKLVDEEINATGVSGKIRGGGDTINVLIRKFPTTESANAYFTSEFNEIKEVRGAIKLEVEDIGDDTLGVAGCNGATFKLQFTRNNFFVYVQEFYIPCQDPESISVVEYYASLIDKKIVESV